MKLNQRPCVLMVEDETDVLRINERLMRRRGYDVLTAATCREAYRILETTTPDVLILDVMLPDGNGFELCRHFRSYSQQPVIFLTGKNETADKIDGLENGCDYYITKPYNVDELIAATERLLQRHLKTRQAAGELTLLKRGPLVLDVLKAKATVHGADADLTSKEFALLLMLVKNEEKEVSPQVLYESIWGVPSSDDVRTIRTHIKNLRKKLGADDAEEYNIVSTYGKGYTFTMIR